MVILIYVLLYIMFFFLSCWFESFLLIILFQQFDYYVSCCGSYFYLFGGIIEFLESLSLQFSSDLEKLWSIHLQIIYLSSPTPIIYLLPFYRTPVTYIKLLDIFSEVTEILFIFPSLCASLWICSVAIHLHLSL